MVSLLAQLKTPSGQPAPSAVVAVPAMAPNMPSSSVMHRLTQPSAPSVHASELAPNMPSSSVLRQSTHVPSFAPNMPSSSAMYRPTQSSVGQRLRTAQANIVGQGTSTFPRQASGTYGGGNVPTVGHGSVGAMPSQQQTTAGPSSRHGALPEHLRQPLPWERSSQGHPGNTVGHGNVWAMLSQQTAAGPSSRHGALPEHLRQPLPSERSSQGHPVSQLRLPSRVSAAANYNTAAAAPSSSRINQTNRLQAISSMLNRTHGPAPVSSIMTQSEAAGGRVNPDQSAAAFPSRASSSEGENK